MRILTLAPLLALAACNVQNDTTNDQVVIGYNQEEAQNVASDIGNTAENMGSAIGNEADRTADKIDNSGIVADDSNDGNTTNTQ
jgi:hypothetical protein